MDISMLVHQNSNVPSKGQDQENTWKTQWLIYWKTNDTSGNPTSARRRSSWLFFNSSFVKWFHLCKTLRFISSSETIDTYVLASPYSRAGDFIICFPFLHRLHLNVSCVSHNVFSLNRKSFLSESSEKCRSASSFSSTTADDSACLEACLWNIFSSIVPVVMKRYTKPGCRDVLNEIFPTGKGRTHILSSVHHAKHEPMLVDQRRDSNLESRVN